MYPVEELVAFNKDESGHFNWLTTNRGYLHSVLLTASAIDDLIHDHQLPSNCTFPQDWPSALPAISRTTSSHLQTTMAVLRQLLSAPDSQLTDPTFYIVLALANLACLSGDQRATDTHLNGLLKLIRLRGGMRALHPKTQFKIDRLELLRCLNTGAMPRLRRVESWRGIFPLLPSVEWEERGITDPRNGDLRIDQLVNDTRLVAAFNDLQCLSRKVNSHFARHARLTGFAFQDPLSSIQVRLLHLQNCLPDSLSECLRLGMLAFITTTFRIPKGRVPYAYLEKHLRSAFQAIEPSGTDMQEILFWLIIVGCISVFQGDEPWIQDRWMRVAGPHIGWSVMCKQRLERVMWLGAIHNQLGQKAVTTLEEAAGRRRS